MWKALVHVRRAKDSSEARDYCILEEGDPGGYIMVEADVASEAEFEGAVRDYLLDYGVDVVELLDIEEVREFSLDGDCDAELRLGTLHIYGADDA